MLDALFVENSLREQPPILVSDVIALEDKIEIRGGGKEAYAGKIIVKIPVGLFSLTQTQWQYIETESE